ncbi:MAG: TatD family hydrolase [Candidatus Diapherotrites archaeon]|uniref:TatD family hydrolase n=1 Tax=Candidatus Iainarchaeum sp. TaxID=3101447 RepID=A0A8T3YMG3_9ARCH|nr:TatD family hydrolase [Candidatus Diapherotrites archaeon]
MVGILLADSHCHIDMLPSPREAVERALKNGVTHVLTNATGSGSIARSLGLSRMLGEGKDAAAVKCAIGIHPGNVLKMAAPELESAFLEVEHGLPQAAAVGEVGLDFKYAKTQEQRALQESVFGKFVSMAQNAGKPVVVHARYSETRCLDILEEMGAERVQMHWFTNSRKTAARAVSLGYYISCGPIILSDVQSAEVVKGIPLESLLLETDAPVQFLGEVSEPSWIPLVCKKVAELKGVGFDEVARATSRNFSRLFK